MKHRVAIVVLIFLPIVVGFGFALAKWPMNAPVIAILGAVMIWLGYTSYARRIDRDVIQPDAKRATPARMYMDGVDFMPTSRNVLYGYHFKSIAAAGPIVGPIVAVDALGLAALAAVADAGRDLPWLGQRLFRHHGGGAERRQFAFRHCPPADCAARRG